MSKQIIITSLVVGLLLTSQPPLSANSAQQPAEKNTNRVVAFIKNKSVEITVGAVITLAAWSFIYQYLQRTQAKPGVLYTATECGNYFVSFTINGKQVTDQEYRKAMGQFYIPFYGGICPVSPLPFEAKGSAPISGTPITQDQLNKINQLASLTKPQQMD